MRKQLVLSIFFLFHSLQAQALSDTLITWQSSSFRKSICRIETYPADIRETRGKDKVVVIRELAENRGVTALEDAKALVETLEEALNIQPENTIFIHYLGGFSFEGSNDEKALLFKSTYSRQENGRLSAPSWKPVSFSEVLEYTDRRFRR